MLVEGTNMLPEHNCKGVTKERGMVCEGGGGVWGLNIIGVKMIGLLAGVVKG